MMTTMIKLDGSHRCFRVFGYVVQLIPMPVLYGVFLYMGFTALPGLQVSKDN